MISSEELEACVKKYESCQTELMNLDSDYGILQECKKNIALF